MQALVHPKIVGEQVEVASKLLFKHLEHITFIVLKPLLINIVDPVLA